MSFADNLKDQAKSVFNRTSERVRESEAYLQLEDRYQNLSPSGQKLTRLLSVLVLLFLLLFIPMSYLSSSSTMITLYEEKRDLVRELFRTYRESSSSLNIAMPPNSDSLRMSIQSIIQRAELTPEQNLGITNASVEGRLIPQNLVTEVLFVKLIKLNLKQIVDIGGSIAGISNSVKMKDLTITANQQDNRYYDVTYKLYSLNVPPPAPEPLPEPEPKNKRRNDNKNENTNEGADE